MNRQQLFFLAESKKINYGLVIGAFAIFALLVYLGLKMSK